MVARRRTPPSAARCSAPAGAGPTDVKPLVGTSSCELAHTAYVVSGRMRVRMNDGTEAEFGPGDAHYVSPGHDAWVVGEEPLRRHRLHRAGAAGRRRVPGGMPRLRRRVPVGQGGQLDHLIAAVQQHASGSHGHDLSRDHILSELQPA